MSSSKDKKTLLYTYNVIIYIKKLILNQDKKNPCCLFQVLLPQWEPHGEGRHGHPAEEVHGGLRQIQGQLRQAGGVGPGPEGRVPRNNFSS